MQQQGPQLRHDTLQVLRLPSDEPVDDDLVDGAKPSPGSELRVEWRDGTRSDSAIQVTPDHRSEVAASVYQRLIEAVTQADRLYQQDLAQPAMPGEERKHSAQRNVHLGDGVGLVGDGAVDGAGELGCERINQGHEDSLLIGEVEVEAAFGAVRGPDDVFHHRAVVALLCEDLFGGVEQALARRLLVSWSRRGAS